MALCVMVLIASEFMPVSLLTPIASDLRSDQAHSRLFSEHAYRKASDPKELFIVPGAGHVDLYDRVKLIPWDKLQSFFGTHLARSAAASSRSR